MTIRLKTTRRETLFADSGKNSWGAKSIILCWTLLLFSAAFLLGKSYVSVLPYKYQRNTSAYAPKIQILASQHVPKNENASTLLSGSTTITTNVEPIPNPQAPIDIRDVAQLKLQPWETVGQCNPPNNVPRECCLGSISNGGMVGYNPQSKCVWNKTQDVYVQAETVAAEYLTEMIPQGPTPKCDICQIMEYLFRHNASIAFVGDSVMAQTANAFQCELYRRGYTVKQRSLGLKPNTTGFRKYGIKDMLNLTVVDSTEDVMANVNMYKSYRPLVDEMRIIAEQHDIVVFDHGLHYLPREQALMKKEMTETLNAYTDSTGRNQRLKLLAWRESIAQNFDSPTGDFHSNAGTPNDRCVPLKKSFKYSIRTDSMKDATKTAGMNFRNVLHPNFQDRQWKHSLRDLVFLPFYEFSSRLLFMKGGECTHPCHTPDLWLPTIRMLRLSMDKLYAA